MCAQVQPTVSREPCILSCKNFQSLKPPHFLFLHKTFNHHKTQSNSLVARARDQTEEDLIALFNRQINVEETTLYRDQEMQLPLWNQSKYDATQCLDHPLYASLERCTEQPATLDLMTMKMIAKDSPMDCDINSWPLSPEKLQVFQYALHEQRSRFPRDTSTYQKHSCSVESSAVKGQPSLYLKMQQNGQISSLKTADVAEDRLQLRPAVEAEADSSTQKYPGDDDDLQYAESYMIAGYGTPSETL